MHPKHCLPPTHSLTHLEALVRSCTSTGTAGNRHRGGIGGSEAKMAQGTHLGDFERDTEQKAKCAVWSMNGQKLQH